MKKSRFYLSLSALLLGLAPNQKSIAQFTSNPTLNTVVRDTANLRGTVSQIATAPNGNSFIVWAEPKASSPSSYQTRMQLVDKYGFSLWGSNGILIDSTMGGGLYRSELKIDREGNAIFATNNYSTGAYKPIVYKIDQAGNYIWGANGIQLIDTTASASFSGGPSLCVTDNNNVLVAYYSEGTKTYITFEKISPNGTRLWNTPQHIIDTGASPKKYERPQMVSTGGENFIMVYVKRTSTYSYSLYAQKYDNLANPVWATPTQVSTRNFPNNGYASLSSDGYGGVFTTFGSGNPANATINDAFAQRIYADGHLWNADGKEIIGTGVTNKNFDAGNIYVPGTNAYFACVPFISVSNGFVEGVAMQKLDTAGNMLFTTSGTIVIPASSGSGTQDMPILSDFKKMDTGLVLIYTKGVGPSPVSIYATKVDFSGNPLWSSAPVTVSNNSSVKSRVMSGEFTMNQLVLSWIDTRTIGTSNNSSYYGGVYTQNIRVDGNLGYVCPSVTLNPFDSVHVNAASIILTGGTPSGGVYSGTGVSNGLFDPAVAGIGTFTIKYVYHDGPCADSATQTIQVVPAPSGVYTISQKDLFACYPNPASNVVTIKLNQNISGNVNVKITGIDGRVLLSDKQNTGNAYSKDFNISGFAKGIYVVEVSTDKGIATTKLIVQ